MSLCVLAALAASACGPEGEEQPAVDHGAVARSYGEVVVRYVQDLAAREEEAPAVLFSLAARFVRGHRGDRQAVRHLLGEDLPETDLDLEECDGPSAVASRSAAALAGPLELLDAGDLLVRLDDDRVRVEDWSFPSVYGVVSGVLYGGSEDLGLPFRPGREYRVSSSGSAVVGAFDIALPAPDEISGLVVDGTEVAVDGLAVDLDGPVEVRWEPGGEASEVLIDLAWTHFASEHRVVCRSRDDGVAELPAAAAARLGDPGASDVRLSIHRITRVPFAADGLDVAEALFVVTAVAAPR